MTVAPSGQLGLNEPSEGGSFFQLEGQAYRVVPIRHREQLGRVVPEITAEKLRLFRFAGLNDPDVYFDENIRRMVDNYRNIFSHTAESMARAGQAEDGLALLDWFMEQVPFETIPGDETSFAFMAQAYAVLGESEKAAGLWKQAEPLVLHRLRQALSSNSNNQMARVARFIEIIQGAYLETQDFEAYAAFTNEIGETIGDPSYRQTADEVEALYNTMRDASEEEAGGPAN